MKKAKENLSTLESTVIYFSLCRRWLYVYFLNSSLDIVAKKWAFFAIICALLCIVLHRSIRYDEFTVNKHEKERTHERSGTDRIYPHCRKENASQGLHLGAFSDELSECQGLSGRGRGKNRIWRLAGYRPRRPGAAGCHCRYRDRKQLPQFSRSSAGHEGAERPDRARCHHSRAGRDRGGSRHHDGRHPQHRRKRGRRNHDRHGRGTRRPRNGRRTLPHRRRRSAGRGDRACKRDARRRGG